MPSPVARWGRVLAKKEKAFPLEQATDSPTSLGLGQAPDLGHDEKPYSLFRMISKPLITTRGTANRSIIPNRRQIPTSGLLNDLNIANSHRNRDFSSE